MKKEIIITLDKFDIRRDCQHVKFEDLSIVDFDVDKEEFIKANKVVYVNEVFSKVLKDVSR